MEPIAPETTFMAMLLQGSFLLRLRRIVGAIVLLTGALALLIHGKSLLF